MAGSSIAIEDEFRTARVRLVTTPPAPFAIAADVLLEPDPIQLPGAVTLSSVDGLLTLALTGADLGSLTALELDAWAPGNFTDRLHLVTSEWTIAPIPEPSPAWLLALGVLALAHQRRIRCRKASRSPPGF